MPHPISRCSQSPRRLAVAALACLGAAVVPSQALAASGSASARSPAHHARNRFAHGRLRFNFNRQSGPRAHIAATAPGLSLAASIPALSPTSNISETGLFAPSSVWNQALPATAPVDPASAQLTSALTTEANSEYVSGVGPWIATKGAGTIYNVPAGQPTVTVQLDTPTLWWRSALQTAFQQVPIPANAQTPAGSDGEMTVIQPSTNKLWEFFHMRLAADGWHAAWGGAIQNLSQSPGYFNSSSWSGSLNAWGATASGLPVVAGEITLSEIQHGVINHALALDVPWARSGTYTWPASRDDGKGGPTTLPEGAHLRLNPSLNLDALNLPPLVLIMARAAQKYGMIVRDQTGQGIGFYVQDPGPTGTNPFYTSAGAPNAAGPFGGRWPTQLLHAFPWSSLQVLQMNQQATAAHS